MRVLLDTHIFIWYAKEQDKLSSVEDVYGFRVLYLHKEQYETYSKLRLNEAQEHYDPSDHLIISHALTNRLTLISVDGKFPFYRNQGLDLIENK